MHVFPSTAVEAAILTFLVSRAALDGGEIGRDKRMLGL